MRVVYLILLSIYILSFSSCQKRPPHVLEEKKMVSLLADMQIAESYENLSVSRTHEDDKKQLGDLVLEKNGVTQEEVDSTLNWYGRNLDDYAALFEKVDIEINKRKERLEENNPYKNNSQQMDLWPYGKHSVVSDLGNSSGWIFNIHQPSIENGEKIVWSLHIANKANLKGTLGVEYSDGSKEVMNTTIRNNNKIELEFQTDTIKSVARLYGSLITSDKRDFPLYADSLRLYSLKPDSMEFIKLRRGQKKIGPIESIRPK